MNCKKILIIEDEPEIRAILAMSLLHSGCFEVTTAASGEEGLRLASENHPDAIVLDFILPGMDGCAVCAEINRDPVLSSIPVIFITARYDFAEVERIKAAGAVACLAKPFDPIELSDRIRSILERAEAE